PVLHESIHAPAELEAVAAVEAVFQMPLEDVERLAFQRAIQVRKELVHGLLARHAVGHGVHTFTKPRRRAHSHSARSSALRPRWSRDMIVPTGQPSISASSR